MTLLNTRDYIQEPFAGPVMDLTKISGAVKPNLHAKIWHPDARIISTQPASFSGDLGGDLTIGSFDYAAVKWSALFYCNMTAVPQMWSWFIRCYWLCPSGS